MIIISLFSLCLLRRATSCSKIRYYQTKIKNETIIRELLEKVRSIRASERRIWQQITDIYAEFSFDYDRKSPTTREFYQMVQNAIPLYEQIIFYLE